MRHNGIYATYLDADRAEVRAQAGDTGRNAMGSVHGGLMFIMGEMAAGLLARGNGRKYVTLDTSFRYLRSSMGEKELVAEASFIKRGKSIVNCRKERLVFIVWISRAAFLVESTLYTPFLTRFFQKPAHSCLYFFNFPI